METMAPREVSEALRRIAAKIEKSEKPDVKLVAADIRAILARLNPADYEGIKDDPSARRVKRVLKNQIVQAQQSLRALQEAYDAI